MKINTYTNILYEYIQGSDLEKPSQESSELAEFIIFQCAEKSLHYDMSVDNTVKTLIIECRLPNNKLVFIDLFTDGVLDLSVYDDLLDAWVVNLPYATKQDFCNVMSLNRSDKCEHNL